MNSRVKKCAKKTPLERGVLCFYTLIKPIMSDMVIEKLPEFDHHQSATFIHDSKSGLRGFIAVHRGSTERPSFGATRFWKYPSEMAALRDALGLARTMSYKLAMAGLPYGGAKAVLMMPAHLNGRRSMLLKAYAERVNYLSGRFVTGTDVGLNQDDLAVMRRASKYMVGMKGNVTQSTAFGILHGIKASLKEVFGSDDIAGRTFAIQGVGKIGGALVRLLYKESKRIVIADTNRSQVSAIIRVFPRVQAVRAADIYREKVDVFSPCAVSRSITRKKAGEVAARIVVGGANSQLEDRKAGDILHRRGILYAPDYVVNAGGLISVVDEYEHHDFDAKRVLRRVLRIRKNLENIFAAARRTRRPTHMVADEFAEKYFNGNT